MRLKSSIWVSAYSAPLSGRRQLRHLAPPRRGGGGAIFVRSTVSTALAIFTARRRRSAFDGEPTDRKFMLAFKEPAQSNADIEARLGKEIRFDPDVWVVEVEDREGRHWLDDQLAR